MSRAAFLKTSLSLTSFSLVLFAFSAFAQEKFAGIEIGSKGVKMTILSIEKDPTGDRISQAGGGKTKNPDLVQGAKDTGKFLPEAIEATVADVKTFYDQLINDENVPAANICVVGSSGLPKATNKDELIASVKKATGLDLEFITPEDEVRLTILGGVPEEHFYESLAIDIGSGNTKFGYLQKNNSPRGYELTSGDFPYATVTFTDTADKLALKTGASMTEAADDLQVSLLAPLCKNEAAEFQLAGRNKVYLTGGLIWAMTSIVRPDAAKEPFVKLTPADLQKFYTAAAKPGVDIFKVDLSAINDPEVLKAAEGNLGAIQNVFTPEQLAGGARVLKTLDNQFNFADPATEVFFAREAYVAWISGFVKERALPAPKPVQSKAQTRGYELFAGAFPYGSVTFTDLADGLALKRGAALQPTLEQMREILLQPALKDETVDFRLDGRNRFYLSGGMVWAMTTLVKPEAAKEDYVVISPADISAFAEKVKPGGVGVFDVDLTKIADAEVLKAAEGNLGAVKNVFTPEQLQGGAQIMLALAEQFELGQQGREAVFPRQAYIAWISGFVKEFSAPATEPGGQLFAGIEIGSKGVKMTVLKVDRRPEGDIIEQFDDGKTKNPDLVQGARDTGEFLPEAITATAQDVKTFYEKLRNELALPAENICIVGSSGLPKASNRDELVDAVQKATGKELQFITADDEVRLTILGGIPENDYFSSVTVDIGSGNTKFGYLEKVATKATVPVVSPKVDGPGLEAIQTALETLKTSSEKTSGELAQLQSRLQAMQESIKNMPEATGNSGGGVAEAELKALQSQLNKLATAEELRGQIAALKKSLEADVEDLRSQVKTDASKPSPKTADSAPTAKDISASAAALDYGRMYFTRNQNNEAFGHFFQATDLNPSYAIAWYFRALAENRLGRDDAARASAAQVGKLINAGEVSPAELARALERVQGTERITIERYVKLGQSRAN